MGTAHDDLWYLIQDLQKRVDLIERRVGLGKYAPVSTEKTAQEFHGERVEARNKYGR